MDAYRIDLTNTNSSNNVLTVNGPLRTVMGGRYGYRVSTVTKPERRPRRAVTIFGKINGQTTNEDGETTAVQVSPTVRHGYQTVGVLVLTQLQQNGTHPIDAVFFLAEDGKKVCYRPDPKYGQFIFR